MKNFTIILINCCLFLFSHIPNEVIYAKASRTFANAHMTKRAQNESPAFIRFQKDDRIPLNIFFSEYKQTFDLNQQNSFKKTSLHSDALGQTHHRYHQYYKDIQVAGAEFILDEVRNRFIIE